MANRIRLQPPADIPKESEHGRFLRQLCEYINKERHGDFPEGSYTGFEDDGTMVAYGDATCWDDVYPAWREPGTGVAAPAYTAYNGNLRAREFIGTTTQVKEQALGFQLQHTRKADSNIRPHLHLYIPDNAAGGVIKFYCEYTWTNIWQTGAVTPLTISGTVTRAANEGISNNHILSFGELDGTGKGISSVFVCRIYRNPADTDDTFAASVWVKSEDIHVLKDTLGSREEFTK